MPVPKRKTSKGRKNRRRAQHGLKVPAMSTCPKCKKVKAPHFRCPFCGHYGEVAQEKPKRREAKKETKSTTKSKKSKTPKKS